MPQELLSIGYPIAVAQTTGYSLPAVKVTAFSTTTTGWTVANDPAFAGEVTVVPDASGNFTLSGGFIRNTTAATVITLKKD